MHTTAQTRFADNVRSRLAEYGWSHQDLADAVGMQRTHVSRTLRGTHSPRLSIVEQFAEALEVDVQTLFCPIQQKAKQPG